MSEFVHGQVEGSLEVLVVLVYSLFQDLDGLVGEEALALDLDGFFEEALVVGAELLGGLAQLFESCYVPCFEFVVDEFELVE